MMQFLIPSGMLVFESSTDTRMSLQQDQADTQRTQDDQKLHKAFKGRSMLVFAEDTVPLFGDYIVCKEVWDHACKMVLHFL